jgi:hypothetical protein
MRPIALVCVSTDLTALRLGVGNTVLASPTATIAPFPTLRSCSCCSACATPAPPFSTMLPEGYTKPSPRKVTCSCNNSQPPPGEGTFLDAQPASTQGWLLSLLYVGWFFIRYTDEMKWKGVLRGSAKGRCSFLFNIARPVPVPGQAMIPMHLTFLSSFYFITFHNLTCR